MKDVRSKHIIPYEYQVSFRKLTALGKISFGENFSGQAHRAG